MNTLVLGGVRSGKSRFAESLAVQGAGSKILIATGTAGDQGMAARIAAHRAKRATSWKVIEEPLHLAAALAKAATPGTFVVVDCLTLWLTNLLCHADADLLNMEVESLISSLPALSGDNVFVANEVGLGIMPINELARKFTDAAGMLHQRLGTLCDSVVLMVAGIPMTIKRCEMRAQPAAQQYP
jgi:adenosylcobinamide kinase/adenosylcobinamide-phosphate guanylyltransferase